MIFVREAFSGSECEGPAKHGAKPVLQLMSSGFVARGIAQQNDVRRKIAILLWVRYGSIAQPRLMAVLSTYDDGEYGKQA